MRGWVEVLELEAERRVALVLRGLVVFRVEGLRAPDVVLLVAIGVLTPLPVLGLGSVLGGLEDTEHVFVNRIRGSVTVQVRTDPEQATA